MARAKATRRICPNGHAFTKTSDCPTCPMCEKQRAKSPFFIAGLSAPARRALEAASITTLKALARHTERDILALHGIGPSALPKLHAALKETGLKFRT
jgi:predicted RecB family nuclease